MKKKLLIIGGIIGVIFIIIVIAAGNSPEGKKSFQKGMDQSKSVVEQASGQNTTQSPKTPEQTIENTIRESLPQPKTNTGKDKIKDVSVTKQVDGGYGVLVSFNADSSGTEDSMKKSIWIDMTKIYTASYKNNTSDVRSVALVAYTSMQDKYGKQSDDAVMKTYLDQPEAQKVNWDQPQSTLALQILPNVWKYDINKFK